MHSMLIAAMMMAAQMMSGMEFNCHHKEKLGISGMEFQLKVGLRFNLKRGAKKWRQFHGNVYPSRRAHRKSSPSRLTSVVSSIIFRLKV